MSTATTEKKPLLPPDERFWQRYSPRGEAPLAGTFSLLIHGLAIGGLVLVGFLLMLRRDSESNKPTRMDAVVLEGMGEGIEGIGGETGFPGEKIPGTELAVNPKKGETEDPLDPNKLNVAPNVQLNVPSPLPLPNDNSDDLLMQLANIGKEADTQGNKEITAPKIKMPGVGVKTSGSGNPKGIGGQGGSGGGPGKGSKGKGMDTGAGLGGKATQQQVFAQRWKFELSGNGKEHADKLQAVGVTVAVRDPRGTFLVITDLKRRPAHAKADNPEKYKDAVKWYNRETPSVKALAQELKLSFVPAQIELLLSKEREELMAKEEADYARSRGRNVDHIQATWFDFRLRDGIYEPVVLKQQ